MNNASLELGGTNWAEKDGNILGYSVGDTSGNFSPQEFTFARGSNLAATRIGKTGLIEKGRENLLLQSNQFDTTWATINASVTSGQSGYDGSSDAWLLNVTATGAYRRIIQSTGGSSEITNSIYAKAGTTDFIAISDVGGAGIAKVWFNLASGTIGTITGSQIIDAKIESIGNGWYRCSVAHQGVSPSYALWFVTDTDNTLTGTIGANVYIQNAQQELGGAASDYIETGASTAQAGILENTPRLDYSGGASCPSLLLEPSRTNLITQSEYFSDSDWDKIAIVVDSNEIISPDGTQNADKLTKSASNALIRQFISTSGENTFSVYIKKGSLSWVRLYIASSTESAECWFDLENGLTGNTSGNPDSFEIIDVNNGWYRCVITKNTTNINNFRIYPSQADDDTSGTSGYIYAWGAQVEAGSYATSYIPTYGVSQTRAQENCYKTGISDLIGQTQGTIFFDWIMNHESPNTSEDLYTLTLSDGTGNKLIAIGNYNQTLIVFIKDTTNQFYDNSYVGTADGARIKLALAYANNDIALYINGTQIATDSSATIPTLSQIRLNTFWSGNLPDSSSVNQLLLFKTRLTNAELAALTTI